MNSVWNTAYSSLRAIRLAAWGGWCSLPEIWSMADKAVVELETLDPPVSMNKLTQPAPNTFSVMSATQETTITYDPDADTLTVDWVSNAYWTS